MRVERPERVHRGEVQDDPLAAVGHLAAKDLAGQDRAHQVQVEHEAQRILGQIEEAPVGAGGGGRFVASRRVDQAVDAAETLVDDRRRLDQAGAVQDVAVHRLGVARVRPHPLHEALRRVQVTVEDDDVRADPRQRADDLAAQNAGPARDDEGPAGKIIHLGELLKVHGCSVNLLLESGLPVERAWKLETRHAMMDSRQPVSSF